MWGTRVLNRPGKMWAAQSITYNLIMEIQRAENLGLLQQKLGIDREARITFRLIESGIVIWDLKTGTCYTIQHGNLAPSVAILKIPQNVQTVILKSDNQLNERWTVSRQYGWSDERETIFTELTYRGTSVLGLRAKGYWPRSEFSNI